MLTRIGFRLVAIDLTGRCRNPVGHGPDASKVSDTNLEPQDQHDQEQPDQQPENIDLLGDQQQWTEQELVHLLLRLIDFVTSGRKTSPGARSGECRIGAEQPRAELPFTPRPMSTETDHSVLPEH